jgi:general secretion pathway protein G
MILGSFVRTPDFFRSMFRRAANGIASKRALAPEDFQPPCKETQDFVRRLRNPESGFTLIELMIVMAIILILTTLAVPSYVSAIKHAREAVLKEDLSVIRNAIDSYTMDKQKAPQSLDDLVQSGYLRVIPQDPMTHANDTWVTDTSDAMYSIDETQPGISDVHSGSEETSSDGQPYSSW